MKYKKFKKLCEGKLCEAAAEDMGVITYNPGDSESGASGKECPLCSSHSGESCDYQTWVNYGDWENFDRPKGHESYQGDEIPFRHKSCRCTWESVESGEVAESTHSLEN